MIIRRMVSGVLATAVIAGGGIALAPGAFAQPRQCYVFTNATDDAWNVYVMYSDYYGSGAFPTLMAFNEYWAASGRQIRAGC
jgi:hypothetical protein